jgi:hypothetical protein
VVSAHTLTPTGLRRFLQGRFQQWISHLERDRDTNRLQYRVAIRTKKTHAGTLHRMLETLDDQARVYAVEDARLAFDYNAPAWKNTGTRCEKEPSGPWMDTDVYPEEVTPSDAPDQDSHSGGSSHL